ncbi:MAG TPA: AAA family ATPase [Candidatus Limnocylindria bacterium]|nr:AAA family ATPase [Candidatus Limnocylindria bacterium]
MVRTGSSPILIGRAADLARLEALWDAAARGESAATALVLGEAGVGKSRLVGELVRRVRATGGQALLGGAMEIDEQNLPYVPILEALRPVVEAALDGDLEAEEAIARARPDLARLFPELGSEADDGASDALAQTRFFGQLLGVLGRLGAQRPVLLVIEDLQWADRSTRDLVAFLGRTLHSARVMLVATARTDALHARHPLTSMLVELSRVERAHRIELGRFTREEHDAQVAAILGRPPSADLLAQTYARSDGNPFYTEELIASGSDAMALSSGLREMLLARVRHLGERTRRLLRVVSVGWSVTHPLLEAVASLAPDELLESLREAVDHSILTTDPQSGRYRFRHPLIAEAVYEDMLPGERIRLHAAYGEALEAQPRLGDPSPARAAAELANHWLRSGHERRALPYLVSAARAARAGFAQAESYEALDRALAVVEVDPASMEAIDLDLTALTLLAAEAAQASGEFVRAAELWERCLELADPAADPVGTGLLHARAGEAYWLLGDRETLTAHRRRAVELVPADPPSAARSWVLSRLASALVMGPEAAEALSLASEAAEVARSVGAVVEEGRAVGVLGVAQLHVGDAEAAVESLTAALAISMRLGRMAEEAIDRSNLSEALHESGRLSEALEVVVAGVERAHAAGLFHTYGETTNAIAVDRAFVRGDWALADRLIEEGLARAPRGLPQVWLALAIAQLEAARGNAGRAADALATVDHLSTAPRVTGWTGPHEQRAHVASWAGRPAEALDHVRAGIATLDAAGVPPGALDWRWLVIHGLRAIGELRARREVGGDPDRLASLEREASELRERFEGHVAARSVGRPASVHLAADQLQMLAEHGAAIGRDDAAAWAAAADAWEGMDHDFDAAFARWREAAAAMASGARDRRAVARPALARARDLAMAMGARPLLDAVASLARRGRIRLDATPVTGSRNGIALTPREREVLVLVADGRSNREIAERLFISPKTASVHVTNIKQKLGVETRLEVVARAVRGEAASD